MDYVQDLMLSETNTELKMTLQRAIESHIKDKNSED
jgi:hypothetical protein